MIIRFFLVLFAILGLAILTLALPVSSWRTGRQPVPELDLVKEGPTIEISPRLWIDTDAACGAGPKVDPDDCFALALLAHAKDIRIVGISTVFGNSDLATVEATTGELLTALSASGSQFGGGPHKGAAVAQGQQGSRQATPAKEALRDALANGPPMTILALGPLTNIAAALQDRPDLRKNIARIVAVMGRRPGHIFHPAEGEGAHSFFGHGPVFRDFNYAKDVDAARSILAMHLPLTLIPYDAARSIMIGEADLKRLAQSSHALQWIANRSQGWLDFWRQEINKEGFYPFDLLAAAHVLRPQLFDCAKTAAWIAPDQTLWHKWLFAPDALMVGNRSIADSANAVKRQVIYCPRTSEELHPWLMIVLAERGYSATVREP
jgi:inosine-uridine nucleoside N-ribohydrolase